MERDCLVGHGAAMLLKEHLMDDSDRAVILICEKCGAPMQIRFNPRRKSRFLGCSKYPDCKFTRPL